MKTNRILTLCLAGLLLTGSGISFTSCQGDDVDTNQFTGGISLNVFGPCPVARGGELRFIGSGMNQVTAVSIPGCADITDIQVISDREIRVTVPQEAEEGYVILRTPNGDIQTETKITYSEPITLDSFSPTSVLPGETLTITGDYLNLMQKVIFADEVEVDCTDFIEHTRQRITLTVPEEAQSGLIILSDTADIPNQIYSEEELTVTLPSVNNVSQLNNAKPGNAIEIQGQHLNLVKQVRTANGSEAEFAITNNETLRFEIPADAADGDVVMIPASGVEVTIAHLTMAVPTEVKATPATGLRAGSTLTLTGKNMELITNVTFPNVAEPIALTSQTEEQVTVVMPETAQSGNLMLNTESGKQVSVAIETLKPVVSGYNPATVSAGENVTLSGSNLDLIASITFGDGEAVAVTPSATPNIEVPITTAEGEVGVTVTMANGETIACPALNVTKPQCCYITSWQEGDIKSGALLEVSIENGDKLTSVQLNGNTVQYIVRDGSLLVSLPADVSGNATLTLVSSNGEMPYTINIVDGSAVVIYAGPAVNAGNWEGYVQLGSELFADAHVGSIITVYISNIGADAQGAFQNSSWSSIDPAYDGFSLSGDSFTMTVNENILSQIQSGGLIVKGKNYTIESVTILN